MQSPRTLFTASPALIAPAPALCERRGPPVVDLVEWALDLWRGSDLLPEDRYAAWAQQERGRLGQLAQDSRIRLSGLALTLGDHEQAARRARGTRSRSTPVWRRGIASSSGPTSRPTTGRPLPPAQGSALLGLEVHLASFDYHRAGLLLEVRDAAGGTVYRHPAYAAATGAPAAVPAVPEQRRQLALGASHELSLLPGMREAARAAAATAAWSAALGTGCLGGLAAWGVLIVGAAVREVLAGERLPGAGAVMPAGLGAALLVLAGSALAAGARRRRTLDAAGAGVGRGTFTWTRGPLAPGRSSPGRRRPDVLVADGRRLPLRGPNRGLGPQPVAMAFATCDHGPLGLVFEIRDIDDRTVYRPAGYAGAPNERS